MSHPSAWDKLKRNRNWLGFWFMLPAMAFLLLFLAYPLVLGIYMSFTDVRIGRPGVFVGLGNYAWLAEDPVFWLSVFNTVFYTLVASVAKFAIGLYLALLLNKHMPFKAIIRALVLIPFIVPTVLSAIAFWWIYDRSSRSSLGCCVSWDGSKLILIFFGTPWNARWSVIFANVWRGVPFIAITLLAGLQTVPRHSTSCNAKQCYPSADVPVYNLSVAHTHSCCRNDVLSTLHLHGFPANLSAHA